MYSYIWYSLLKVYFHAPKCTFNPNPIWDQKWKHGKCRIMVCNSKTLQCAKESKCGELPAVFIFTNKAFFTDNSDRAQDLVVGFVFTDNSDRATDLVVGFVFTENSDRATDVAVGFVISLCASQTVIVTSMLHVNPSEN